MGHGVRSPAGAIAAPCLAFCLWASLLVAAGCRPAAPEYVRPVWEEREPVVRIHAPRAVLDPTTLSNFTAFTRIRVFAQEYDQPDELAAALMADPGYCDLIVARDYQINIFRQLRLLHPIDQGRLPGLSNIEWRFLNLAFDPGNRYSVPFLWGTFRLAFSPDDFPEPPASWAELWAEDSGIQPLLPGNRHDAFGLVLLQLGLPVDSRETAHLEKARHKLLDLAARGAFQPPAAAAALLAAGSNLLAVVASDCAARLTNGLAFTIPQEGTLLWIMSLAIPRDGRHLNEAHALIEYLLQPEVAAPAATAAAAATPNKGARDFLEFQVSENPLIYPESAQLARCRLNPAVDDDPQGLINQTWSAIRRAMLAGGERRLEGGP